MNADASLDALIGAAREGSAEAGFRCALALFDADRIEESQQWYLRAAQAGHVEAAIQYARMRLYGLAGLPSPQTATEWLERAERAGHPAASELLANIAIGGVALPRDGRINERLLRAMQADFPPALLAAAVHFGRKPHPDDQTLCMELLERAAARGHAVAAALLAERLAHGEGCEARAEVAEHLWTQLQAAGMQRLPRFTLAPPGDAGAAPPRHLAVEDALSPPPVRLLHDAPRVAVAERLFSADECRLLIASAQPHLHDSNTVDPITGETRNMSLRTSSDASFDPLLENCALRLAQMRMAAAAGIDLPNAERLTVLHYRPGQEYKPHRDYLPSTTLQGDRPRAGNRTRTICVYLNAVDAGGATVFPDLGLSIAPTPGSAVIFDNMTADGGFAPASLHAGTPVEAGEKWLGVLWIRQGRYRDF